ncbi:MAG: ribonuclease P protein component [Planctomycetia bacterium]|nr:ribonuclease P protein component [Planctomycetia bacterium]
MFSFPPIFRLRTRSDFAKVYARRCRAGDDCFLVFADLNGLDYSRIGLSVSKKVGNSPCRNRWKRLIREAFRRNREDLPSGFDFIIIPSKKEPLPLLEEVVFSLKRNCRRAAEKARKIPQT